MSDSLLYDGETAAYVLRSDAALFKGFGYPTAVSKSTSPPVYSYS